MAKEMKRNNQEGYEMGRDAAYIKPKLIPDYELLPRDDSGGPDWDAYNAQFGDGGYVVGDKAHLSARGGKDDDVQEDEQTERPRAASAMKAGKERPVAPPPPTISKKRARE